jgi:hypothetical protein
MTIRKEVANIYPQDKILYNIHPLVDFGNYFYKWSMETQLSDYYNPFYQPLCNEMYNMITINLN